MISMEIYRTSLWKYRFTVYDAHYNVLASGEGNGWQLETMVATYSVTMIKALHNDAIKQAEHIARKFALDLELP